MGTVGEASAPSEFKVAYANDESRRRLLWEQVVPSSSLGAPTSLLPDGGSEASDTAFAWRPEFLLVVTIRGEVRSLDQISRASRVIDGFGGDTEIVNLVRLRGTSIGAGTG